MTGPRVFLTVLACLAGLLSTVGATVLLSEVPCKGDTTKQKYTLVFEGLWSAKRFPKQYPIYRPKASWSSLVGVTHNDEYTLWHKGEIASEGVKLFAEKAGSFKLFSDFADSKGTSGKFFADEIKNKGVGERKTDFAIDADHSKVSFMVKIVPSPDWFVGLDSKDLCQNGKWIDQFSTRLGPWDAGTDKGFTFTSPNWATVPQEPVFQISSTFPNHPANSFYYPSLRKLPALARVTLTREGADLSKLDELAELVDEAEEVVSMDCEVSNWSGFSRCNRRCGGGIKARSRYVKQKPLNGGKPCPQLAEIQQCNTDPCDAPKPVKTNGLSKSKEPVKAVEEVKEKPEVVAVDCAVSKWSDFSKCSRSCGGGSMARSRNITQKPLNGGKQCPELSDRKQCNMEACPVIKFISDNEPEKSANSVEQGEDEPKVVATDCKVSVWSSFSRCNRRCGGGVMVRARTITQKPLNGGKPCPELSERRECNTEPCPVTKATSISENDIPKPENSAKSVEEVEEKVVATDCKVSAWSGFGRCNRRCGGGVMLRARTITQKPLNGGKPCPELSERRECNMEPCPVTKATSISENDIPKPEKAANSVEEVQVETEVVATDCKVSAWSGFGRCNRRCGGGVMVRARTITQKPLNDGKPCPHLYERRRCNLEPCPVTKAINVVPSKPQLSAEVVDEAEEEPEVRNCEVSRWSRFSRCSRSCGGGLMVRSRYIRQNPQNGGRRCPRLSELRRCNLNPCPALAAISNDDRLQRLLARFRQYGRRQE
ncbi:spondin-1-like isoform X1 [Branchiostoma floridae]|uniref:Spondin-1-like isoform X1 n=1 Tax=Branchiostoma floridae TaxID=7739 RepID=A0A9J7MPW0_BRAFL|nr:spondin-1-like isoform X1 [Branchiostoma floridae]